MDEDKVDYHTITKKYANVIEINELVGIWEIEIENCPVKLKIKVFKTPHLPEHPYIGVANYAIQNPDQAGPYQSIYNCETIQDALEDALKGFLHYFSVDKVDETKFVLDKNW